MAAASSAVASSRVGGLAEALSRGRSSPWSTEPKAIRPRPVRSWVDAPEESEAGRPLTTGSSSSSTTTAPTTIISGDADPAGLEAGLAELRRLFAAECSLSTSSPGFGVSPPVRSGAANGLVHDSLWHQEAPRACQASLRALHERASPRCLSSCAGDYRLLMASPDQGLQLLAGAVEGDDADMDGAPSATSSRSLASSRASPVVPLGGWHPAHCPSPEPSDLFSY